MRLSVAIILLASLLASSACSKKSSSSSSTSSSSSSGLSSRLVSISGDVLASTGFVSSRRIGPRAQDSCSSARWTGVYVGGGGSVAASGTVTGGSFTIPSVQEGKEMVITFAAPCGQRCLVKAGDEGVLCNITADAVITAFEVAMEKEITDVSFDGKSISKVGAAIVEAAKNDSTSAENFKNNLAGCASLTGTALKDCYVESIENSAFAGAFKMMQALAGTWSVEALFTLIADTFGYSIRVDSFIYSSFATAMDEWFSTDFVAKTRVFVKKVIDDQIANGNKYPIKLVCELGYSKYHGGGRMIYFPVLLANDQGIEEPSCKNRSALEDNGLTTTQINLLFNSMSQGKNGGGGGVDLGGHNVGCNNSGPSTWDNPYYFCAWNADLTFVSKSTEANRNDPAGTNTGDRSGNQQSISLIDAYQEVMDVIENLDVSKAPSGCVKSMGNDGPPDINTASQACKDWFGASMTSTKKYFAGMMGLYMYLKDPAGYATNGSDKLSLDDIYKIFTHENFLGTRLTAWGNGFNGASISVSSSKGSWNQWVPPVLAYDEAGDFFKFQSVFRYDNVQSASKAQILDALAKSVLPKKYAFDIFKTIPTSAEIQDYIFGASHHEEWNPFGSKFFYVPGVKETGIPIFCKMTSKSTGKVIEADLNSDTSISCLTSAQITSLGIATGDETGVFTLPADFDYPYVLQGRGWQGDTKGNLYALVDRKTGFPVRPAGNDIFVYEMRAGNGVCKTAGESGQVVTALIQYGYGDDTKKDAVTAYCLNMSSFSISGQYQFYYGGNVSISQKDGNGNTWSWMVNQIGRVNSGDSQPIIMPVCLFAPTGEISFDSEGLVSVSSGTVNATTGEFSALGDSVVDQCGNSGNYTGSDQYYIVMMGDGSQASSKTSLKAYFIKSSGDMSNLRYRNWQDGDQRWEDTMVWVKASVMESSLNQVTSGDGTTNLVAPVSSPVFTQWVQVLNQKHDAKFDPYCDNVLGNGSCNCYVAGTTTLKDDPDQCSLMDDAAEPTISQPLCPNMGPQAASCQAFFTTYGGKSGSQLKANNVGLNGQYMNQHQIYVDFNNAFFCKYKLSGETTYRRPTFMNWGDFSVAQEGCPASEGAATLTQGPVRLINPKPMKNAFNVAYPNRMITLMNYATKTVGQGVTLDSTEKLFSFDEALALIALRYAMPPDNVVVYRAGTTTKSDSAIARDAFPFMQQIQVGNKNYDPVSAVLRGLIKPTELKAIQ